MSCACRKNRLCMGCRFDADQDQRVPIWPFCVFAGRRGRDSLAWLSVPSGRIVGIRSHGSTLSPCMGQGETVGDREDADVAAGLLAHPVCSI